MAGVFFFVDSKVAQPRRVYGARNTEVVYGTSMAASLRSMLFSCHLTGLLRPPCRLSRLGYGLRGLSISFPVSKDPNTPRKAGDKGPGKNYRRKVAKLTKTLPEEGGGAGGGLDSLLMGMKHMEGTPDEETGGKETPDLMYSYTSCSIKVY